MQHTIKPAVGGMIAADTQSSVAALDMAVVMQSRLCASVMEAATASRLPINTTQPVLEAMTAGMQSLADSRANMVTAVRQLISIQKCSTLSEEVFGCPGGPEKLALEMERPAAQPA